MLVMDAIFELDALHAVLAQAVLAAEENKDLVGLAMGDDENRRSRRRSVGDDRAYRGRATALVPSSRSSANRSAR